MYRLDATLLHDGDPDDPVLFQEQLVEQAYTPLDWAIAVGSVVLNRTGRNQAFPVIERLINEWSPLRCANAEQPWMFRQLCETIRPAGLAEAKAIRIVQISKCAQRGVPPDHWLHLGEYGKDSVFIFTDGKYLLYALDKLPSDKWLRLYVQKWRLAHEASTALERDASADLEEQGLRVRRVHPVDPDPAVDCGRGHRSDG